MTVNVLFFAITSVLVLRLEKQFGVAHAAIAGLIAFSLLLVFGEIFPKSVAYGRSKSFSIAAAIPAYMCLKILTPIASVFRFFIVEPVLRLFLGPVKKSESIGIEEFRSLMEQMKRRGMITAEENRLLGEIVELSLLRVKHCMRPRVDMIACGVDEPAGVVKELLQRNKLTKIPVYSGKLDNIIGYAELRDLLLRPESKIKKCRITARRFSKTAYRYSSGCG
jgi:putative hemolysin